MNLEIRLKEELQNELPGTHFHQSMIPTRPYLLTPAKTKVVKAAVSIIIYLSGEKSYQFLLIKRADYSGHHSGQISFPGGKTDITDATLLHTAIRETYEEIGIRLSETANLGKLTPLHIQVSNFHVTPFVFYINEPKNFIIDKNEVQYVIRSDISLLLTENTLKTTRIKVKENEFQAPYFDIEGEVVWGATSMILAEFKEILKRIERQNPGIFHPGL